MMRKSRQFRVETLEGRLAPSGGLHVGPPADSHGAAVSEVAKTTDPGPDHGVAVSEVAKTNAGTDDGGDAGAGSST